ncbi:hypothetical protein [Hyalangium versicolor]|uniref:hypothetical protein n=1 Tax=Hyalangium versicolor TaxID=2861190 RepID=UPI001CCF4256|nr:hypothetical protein [Hyalangium versicolor]
MKRILTSCLATLSLLACDSTKQIDPPPAVEELAGCTRERLEEDLTRDLPLSGPAVREDGTLAPGQYILSSTYLKMKTDAQAQARFQELIGPINEALSRQPGLMAVAFASSERCKTARTFTVWKDEAAMYEFVTGDAHLAAMSAVSEVSRGGSIVTHWPDDERGASWEKAARQLGADEGPFY